MLQKFKGCLKVWIVRLWVIFDLIFFCTSKASIINMDCICTGFFKTLLIFFKGTPWVLTVNRFSSASPARPPTGRRGRGADGLRKPPAVFSSPSHYLAPEGTEQLGRIALLLSGNTSLMVSGLGETTARICADKRPSRCLSTSEQH